MDEGKVYHVESVRKIDGQKVILNVDYLNGNIIHDLTQQHAQNSLYEYIEKELGLPEKRLQVEHRVWILK